MKSTAVFHVSWTWTRLTRVTDLLLSSLVSSCFVLACQLWWREDSQSLDQGRLNSMPVKRAPDLHCKSGLVPSSLMYNNISTDRRVTPLDPPTQLLTWPHCSSFTDPSTLILEVGRQVLLGQHLALNYWLNRHFLCHVWMCRVRRAAKVFRCFTANVHLVGTFTV